MTMNLRNVILILVAVVLSGLVWLVTNQGNEYEERDARLDSSEAKEALAMMRQLAKSTNYLANCMPAQISPMAKHEVHKKAVQMAQAKSIELTGATWKGQYLSVGVACRADDDETTAHYFYLKPGEEGELELVGVHQ